MFLVGGEGSNAFFFPLSFLCCSPSFGSRLFTKTEAFVVRMVTFCSLSLVTLLFTLNLLNYCWEKGRGGRFPPCPLPFCVISSLVDFFLPLFRTVLSFLFYFLLDPYYFAHIFTRQHLVTIIIIIFRYL